MSQRIEDLPEQYSFCINDGMTFIPKRLPEFEGGKSIASFLNQRTLWQERPGDKTLILPTTEMNGLYFLNPVNFQLGEQLNLQSSG